MAVPPRYIQKMALDLLNFPEGFGSTFDYFQLRSKKKPTEIVICMHSICFFSKFMLYNCILPRVSVQDFTVFKKDIKVQIHLYKAFRFTTSFFLKSNNSWFKKGKMYFLKSRVYCTLKFCYAKKHKRWVNYFSELELILDDIIRIVLCRISVGKSWVQQNLLRI